MLNFLAEINNLWRIISLPRQGEWREVEKVTQMWRNGKLVYVVYDILPPAPVLKRVRTVVEYIFNKMLPSLPGTYERAFAAASKELENE